MIFLLFYAMLTYRQGVVMALYQLDLFSENTEVCFLKQEVEDLKKRTDNLRRGIFSRHSQLEKMYFELKDEVEKLKSVILETAK